MKTDFHTVVEKLKKIKAGPGALSEEKLQSLARSYDNIARETISDPDVPARIRAIAVLAGDACGQTVTAIQRSITRGVAPVPPIPDVSARVDWHMRRLSGNLQPGDSAPAEEKKEVWMAVVVGCPIRLENELRDNWGCPAAFAGAPNRCSICAVGA